MITVRTTREELFALLVKLGQLEADQAKKTSTKRIQIKALKLPEAAETDEELAEAIKTLTGSDRELYDALCEIASGNGELEWITGEEGTPPEPKEKANGKPSKKEKAKKEEEVVRSRVKSKRPGIVAAIVEQLKKASEKKPVTKVQILTVLTTKFPDRNASSMQSTLNTQLGHDLRVKGGYNLQKDGKGGYWIVG